MSKHGAASPLRTLRILEEGRRGLSFFVFLVFPHFRGQPPRLIAARLQGRAALAAASPRVFVLLGPAPIAPRCRGEAAAEA